MGQDQIYFALKIYQGTYKFQIFIRLSACLWRDYFLKISFYMINYIYIIIFIINQCTAFDENRLSCREGKRSIVAKPKWRTL